MTDVVDWNRNVFQTASGHLAAIGLERIGHGPLGNMLTPATWTYNWKTQGSTPSSVDVGYWAVSLGGGIFAPVGIAISYLKSLVDDDMQRKVLAVRDSEAQSPYRQGILALAGWGPPSALAAAFAKSGGTAWQHHNGVWVTVVDGKGKMISNFRPTVFRAIVRPVWPLQAARGGGGLVITDKFPR